MKEENPIDRHWSLDRKVPLPLIVTLAVLLIGQTAVAFWWGSNQATRLEIVERQQRDSAPQAERIIRLEEKVGVVQQGVNEIKNDLKTLLANPRPR